jgi:hypothetical protein
MQLELCPNPTPQSSPVLGVNPEVLPVLPLPVEMEGLGEGRKKKKWVPGPNARQSHPLHRTWANMIQRCTNPNNTHYNCYGGRGITICERWKDFLKFAEDVGARPTSNHTLERIKNDGPYCPQNIRWATRKEQSSNMRINHFIEYNGERLTITAWGERLGVTHVCIRNRIKRGWSIEESVTTPPK